MSDFDEELIRESESLMSITENGRRKRISKHKVVVKQLMKQAMTGNIPAASNLSWPLPAGTREARSVAGSTSQLLREVRRR